MKNFIAFIFCITLALRPATKRLLAREGRDGVTVAESWANPEPVVSVKTQHKLSSKGVSWHCCLLSWSKPKQLCHPLLTQH